VSSSCSTSDNILYLDDWVRRERFVFVGWSGLLLLPNGILGCWWVVDWHSLRELHLLTRLGKLIPRGMQHQRGEESHPRPGTCTS
jgi:hypothetical protein